MYLAISASCLQTMIPGSAFSTPTSRLVSTCFSIFVCRPFARDIAFSFASVSFTSLVARSSSSFACWSFRARREKRSLSMSLVFLSFLRARVYSSPFLWSFNLSSWISFPINPFSFASLFRFLISSLRSSISFCFPASRLIFSLDFLNASVRAENPFPSLVLVPAGPQSQLPSSAG